jgi:hypothetical protein
MESQIQLINKIAKTPELLGEAEGGPVLAVELARAALVLIDTAARADDQATLVWLSPKLWASFAPHVLLTSTSVDFIDINEYLRLTLDSLREGNDPGKSKIIREYRQVIDRELNQAPAREDHR